MKRLLPLLLLVLIAGGCAWRAASPERPDAAATDARRAPQLSADLAGVVVPVNIAPLNFVIREPGTAYFAAWSSSSGSLEAGSRDGKIALPLASWRRLLSREGDTLTCVVSVKGLDGRWQRFAPFSCTVGPPIDPYLSYRLIGPVYSFYRDTRIMQRDLTSFRERTVLAGGTFADGCVNCHIPWNGSPDRTTLGIRGEHYGLSALVSIEGRVTKMDAVWGYNSWHPSGQAVAYSMNKVRQFFHDTGAEVRDVVDLDSDLMVYRVDSGAVETAAAIAAPDRLESYPTWSPDGQWLYFCSAPILWQDRDKVPPPQYTQIRYDLRRARYDVASHEFGPAETVLTAAQTGRSLLTPRVSPDGRWLLACMTQYGCFPVYQPSSDLFLLDLQTRAVKRLPINSDQSESWHSWSTNSRWIAFSSKRDDGVFTRTYLAYVDEQGNVARPFAVPQRDPAFYDTCLKTFSVPELMTAPVRTNPRALARAVRADKGIKLKLPEVSMTKKAKTPAPAEPWSAPTGRR